MKRHLVSLSLVACMAMLIAGVHAVHVSDASAKGATSRYLVIAPHDAAECMKALDETKDMAPGALGKWDFGCEDGDHTGYLVVNASSSEEALKNVPADLREKAKAIKVHKFTAAELKAAHEKMKM